MALNEFEITAEERQTIRTSFVRLIPRSFEATGGFYARLFREHPGVQPLFPSDMEAQQDKLVETLAFLVDRIDRPEELKAECQALGRRHVGYGALPAHYPIVGQMLVEEFANLQNPPMTQDELQVWKKVYGIIAELMLSDT